MTFRYPCKCRKTKALEPNAGSHPRLTSRDGSWKIFKSCCTSLPSPHGGLRPNCTASEAPAAFLFRKWCPRPFHTGPCEESKSLELFGQLRERSKPPTNQWILWNQQIRNGKRACLRQRPPESIVSDSYLGRSPRRRGTIIRVAPTRPRPILSL